VRLLDKSKRVALGIGSLGRGMLSSLVPPLCLGCGRRLSQSEKWLCTTCRIDLMGSARPRSRLIPLDRGRSLSVRYAVEYTPVVSSVITQMKYFDKPGIAAHLARLLIFAAGDLLSDRTALVPIPMHPSRKRERGYNQSEVLCREVLVKRRNTPRQAGLEKHRRIRNIIDSFEVRVHLVPESKMLLLVDDVVTTGSTLRECAEELLNHGIEGISACVVCSSS
jgi:competence protein ComFC